MICLVHMPFSMLTSPSMALSVLKGEAVRAGLETVIEYGNLRLAKHLGLKQYSDLLNDIGAFNLLGELLFSRYAGFSCLRDPGEYFAYVRQEIAHENVAIQQLYERCHQRFATATQVIDPFLTELAEAVLAYRPRIVGCDITYQQQNASLALLQRLKQRDPSIVTVLGGNSCSGDIGQALADYMPAVDYVFSGEADDQFAGFCKLVLAGAGKAAVHAAFPCALVAGGQAAARGRDAMQDMAVPDFDDYFRNLSDFGLRDNIIPCLLIEGSRGCWWGQKRRCSFCGIHTSEETLQYRQKDSKVIVDELARHYQRFGITNFIFTDCILSQTHIRELLPLLAQIEPPLELFAEVKSNLSKASIRELRQAGFLYLQPGIESLQDDLLRLMHKGNRAIKHVEFLKHCRYYGISVIWNLLKDLPGDQAGWYWQIGEMLPLLSHLQPPTRFSAIIFQRNSRYTTDPGAYGLELEPSGLYAYTGPDDAAFIRRTAEYYVRSSGDRSVASAAKAAVWQQLARQIDDWVRFYDVGRGDRLSMSRFADRLEISDLRNCARKSCHTLEGVTKEVYLLADEAIASDTVYARLGKAYPLAAIDAAVAWLLQNQLLLRIGDELLALAVPFPAYPYRQGHGLPVGKVDLAAKEAGACEQANTG